MKYPTFAEPADVAKHYKLKDRWGFDLAPLQLEDLVTASAWDRMKWFYEVGVGKTVCSTVHALQLGHHCHIVIVPPILILQWVKWLRKVDPDSSVLQYQGTVQERKHMRLIGHRWIVMSLNIFRIDFDKIQKQLANEHPHIILDEAHNAKNSASKLFKKVNNLAAWSTGVQMLTGTPTSKPTDAYAYIKLVTPDIYRSYGHFEDLHVGEKDYFGAITEYRNLPLVKQNLMLQSCKRTKEEMFPGIVKPRYQTLPYELDPLHMRLYNELMEEQLLLLDDGRKIDATTAQKLYHYSQQLVINLDYFTGDPSARSAIYDLIDQTIEETQCMNPKRSKLIIWTWYTMTTASIMDYLSDYGAVACYSGADSKASIKKFMEDPQTRIGVFNPGSAGLGLEAQFVCWENLFVEYNTSPSFFIQSVGRTDRMGQKHMPTMRIACAQGTVQQSIEARLLHNGDLVQQVEGSLQSIRQAIYGQA